MPLNRKNTHTFHRVLYGGILERVQLLKREDDQRQGTVTAYTIYQARKSSISKTGEPIDGEQSSNYRTTWHIPRSELDRIGVRYLNAADRFVELDGPGKGRTWQPESTTGIDVKLFENYVTLECLSLKSRT